MLRRAPILAYLAMLSSGCQTGQDPAGVGAGSDASDPSNSEETGVSPTTETGDPDPGPTTTASTSSVFVPEDDTPSPNQCDPFAQDCEVGEKCVPYASSGGNWDANKCVPVLGDAKVGEPCTYSNPSDATDSCDASSMCWNVGDVDGEPIGTCSAFCSGTPDDPMCPAASSCSISCDGSLSVCIPSCDPIVQDCLGLGCYWTGSDFMCVFAAGEGIEEGQACGFINDCKPGLICVNADNLPGCADSACCTAFCELSAPACAIPGTECVAFFDEGMAAPGYEDVGTCLSPPG